MEEDVQTSTSPVMKRVFGLPLIVWVGIVAVVAYLWFSRRSKGSGGGLLGRVTGGGSTSGGGGTATSGSTRIDKGAVSITVNQGNAGKKNHQPKPPVHGKKSFVAVPDVQGMRYPAAARELQHAGLRAHRVEPYVGNVSREWPRQGKKVHRGSTVNLTGSGQVHRKMWGQKPPGVGDHKKKKGQGA